MNILLASFGAVGQVGRLTTFAGEQAVAGPSGLTRYERKNSK